MKKAIVAVLVLLLSVSGVTAQKITDIQFSYFVAVQESDSNPRNTIQVDGYKGWLFDKKWVSENPATKAQLIKLLNNLKANGTEDINKCFIPRHVVTAYSNDKILYHVLVCFECDGIRFSNQLGTSNIKSVTKREKWMKELKTLFIKQHFLEGGVVREEE